MSDKSLKFSCAQFLCLLCLCIPNFLQNVIVSINAPLFPPAAASRGLSAATYGLVLSFFRAVMLLSVVLIGTQVDKIGIKRTFVCGVFLNGISPILLGFVNEVNGAVPFLILSMILRGFEAVGAASFICAMYMVPSFIFKNNVSLIFGIIQTVFQVSNSVGPVLGTWLDTSFGFTATYTTFGLCQILSGIFATIFLPNLSTSEFKNYWSLLQIPSVLIYIYACAVAGAGPESISAIMQPTLDKIGMSEMGIGWMFLVMAVPQLAGPLWGYMLDHMRKPQLSLVASSVLMVVAYVILGPVSEIVISSTIFICGLLLFGFAQGVLIVGSISILRLEIIRQDTVSSISFLSIAYLSSTSIGASLGPLVTGLVYTSYGFTEATIFLIAITALLAGLALKESCDTSAKLDPTVENKEQQRLLPQTSQI